MDKKALLTPGRVPEDTVDLPGLGTVKVRGLSRGEVLDLRDATGSTAEQEARYVAKALLEPVMSEAEVGKWQKVAANDEFLTVVEAIYRLSGFGDGAEKAAYKSVRE